jgi:hypothetical protein
MTSGEPDWASLRDWESVLVTKEGSPSDTRILMRQGGELVPDPNWTTFSAMHTLTLVSVIEAGEVASRWWVARDAEGTPCAFEECFEVDVSGYDLKFAELDEKYLTPRVLAGLAAGDPYALEQWNAHEAEAAALRETLPQAKADAEARAAGEEG